MEKTFNRALLLLGIGLALGAGITSGIFLWINHNNASTQRAVIAAYQSALADRDGQLVLLDSQLRELGGMAQQNRQLSEQLVSAFREHLGIISQARSDYERGLANLKLAEKIFRILRSHYDQDYKNPGSPGG